MPAKVTPEKLLSKHLGDEGATAVLGKIDKMIAEGATATAIEKAIGDDINNHIANSVTSAVVVKVGPLQPIKVNTVNVAVGSNIKTFNGITVGGALRSKVGIQVGPPLMVKPG